MQRKQDCQLLQFWRQKNFKVKYDFQNFCQGTCRLKCNNNIIRTMTLINICVSVLKFEINMFFTPRYYKQMRF